MTLTDKRRGYIPRRFNKKCNGCPIVDREKYETMCSNCRMRIQDSFSLDIMREHMSHILTYDESKNEFRQTKAEVLSSFSNLINDIVALYDEYEMLQGHLWNGKGTLENNDSLRAELERIYSMRTWKLVQKYISFMEETRVGGILGKGRDTVFTILSRAKSLKKRRASLKVRKGIKKRL